MPEGPSIVILKEAAEPFANRKILAVSGNSKIDQQRLLNQKVLFFKSWGKHFLICFKDFTVRIHLLMFGSYRINEEKDAAPRLRLEFKNGTLIFYTCSVKLLEGFVDGIYDWSGDVMNDSWDPKAAKKKLAAQPKALVCDALLDQDIFAGVGNIIKNEVLYRIRIQPESKVGKLPAKSITQLIKEARIYSFQFLEWKKEYKLKEHWLAHTRKICERCQLPFIKKHTGVKKRRSFFCTNCQVLYS